MSKKEKPMQSQAQGRGAQIAFRVPADVRAGAEKAAADDSRTLSSLMEKLLKDYLKEKGYLPQ